MKNSLNIICFFLAIVLISCNRNKPAQSNYPKISGYALTNDVDTISFYTGIYTETKLKTLLPAKINSNVFNKAVHETFENKDEQMNKVIANYMIGYFFEKLQNVKKEKNIKEGLSFLKQNKLRRGIVTTKSGIQYFIIKEGSAIKPDTLDKIKVLCKAYVLNGSVFINSISKPDTFLLTSDYMPGLQEALRLMRVGSHYKVYLPSELGFRFDPPAVKGVEPFMVSIFDIEILSIVKRK